MDITVRDKRGRSVLSYATEAGAMKAIKRLLNCQERQNNVVRLLNDSGDAKRILASQLCCLGGTLRCRRPPMQTKKIDSQVRSVDNMAGGNVFGIAAKRQHAKVIKELGKYYRDGVNSRDRDGRRPLCESVWGPNTDVLRELLDLGADINLPDFNRKPPVAYGIEKLDLVRFLIERGADINLPDNDGHTPLW